MKFYLFTFYLWNNGQQHHQCYEEVKSEAGSDVFLTQTIDSLQPISDSQCFHIKMPLIGETKSKSRL